MLPNVMLWASERAEEFRGLDTQKAGVAFLAGTIFLRPISPNTETDSEEGVVLRPRLQPLHRPDGVRLMAVLRIETPGGWSQAGYQSAGQLKPPQCGDPYTEAQRRRIVSLISSLARFHGIRGEQIDFDATRSEQAFYRSLLEDLRKQLPPTMPISITALASWCIGDQWLEQLPSGTINEAVPILFRMGSDAPNVARF